MHDLHTSRFSPTLWSLYILGFFSASSFALVIPSIFFFMIQLQLNTKYYGVVVGSFSLGQVIGSVPVGFLSAKVGTKISLILCLAVNVLGFIMYAFSTTLVMLIVSRFIAGLGTGYITVIRGYVGQACSKEIRSSVSGYVTMGQMIGYALGPVAFASVFTPVHIVVGNFVINANTGPPLVSALLKILAILLIVLVFKPVSMARSTSSSSSSSSPSPSSEPAVSEEGTLVQGNIQQPLLKRNSDSDGGIDDDGGIEQLSTLNDVLDEGGGDSGVPSVVGQTSSSKAPADLPASPWPALVIISWLYFIDIGIFAGFETNISPLVKHQFNWGTLQSNLFTGSAGVTALFYVVAIDFSVRRFGWSDALVWGLCMGGLILGSLFLLSPPHYEMPMVSLILAVLTYPIAGPGISVLYAMYATIGTAYKMNHQKITGLMVLSGALGRLVGPLYAAFAYHFPGDDIIAHPPSPQLSSQYTATATQPLSTANAYGTLLLYGPMAALTLVSCLLFVYLISRYPLLCTSNNKF